MYKEDTELTVDLIIRQGLGYNWRWTVGGEKRVGIREASSNIFEPC